MTLNRQIKQLVALAALALILATTSSALGAKKKKQEQRPDESKDRYAAYVWPPPPDKPRIKLEAIFTGIASVEAKNSKWKKLLIGASPQKAYDRLRKPFGVEFDPQGRLLVTDWESGSLLRFDDQGERMDVLGKRASVRLQRPMGLTVSPAGIIYVADGGAQHVVAFDENGGVQALFGNSGELENPVDVELSPSGSELYVADAKAHKIVVFEVTSGKLLTSFGSRGDGPGQFSFPTSLAFNPEGDLLVLDQLNARIQLFDADNNFLDVFGGRGVGFGSLQDRRASPSTQKVSSM